MGRVTWTTGKDERLRSLYGVMPTKELAKELGVSESAVWSRARRAGLTSGRCGYSGDWYPDEIETLVALYPILGQDCAPLCNHSRIQVNSRANYIRLHRDFRKRPKPNHDRRKYALMTARWCVSHGLRGNGVIEECAAVCGCTPDMMRLVLPQLLREEAKHRKR